MSHRRPIGFRVLAVCAAFYGVFSTLVAFTSWRAWERGEEGLIAVMAMITVEALWNARPWAFRVSLAFALAFYLGLLLESFVIGFDALQIVLSVGFIGPVLGYLHHRTAKLRALPAGVP